LQNTLICVIIVNREILNKGYIMKISDPKPVVKNRITIDERILKYAEKAEDNCSLRFSEIARNARINGEKVLNAFINSRMSAACLTGTTGYGYGDIGRDTIDKVFAEVFGAEDALVRHNFVSGTHAITTALFGILRTGDKLVSLTGKPYDTLHSGICGDTDGSLGSFGIKYEQSELLADGTADLADIFMKGKDAKVGFIQRSRGYSLRPALTIPMIAEIIKSARNANPNIIIIVDNCYGEFIEAFEPCDVGADLVVGSLIKNPGGGIAETGGYIAGKADLIEKCADRLTAIGMGKETGCSLNQNKFIAQGLFLAPETVASALKTAAFAVEIFTLLGFKTYPSSDEKVGDIVTAISMPDEQSLISFCKGVQKGSPIDSHLTTEPWDMPGYNNKVIMAAGAFNMGSSIEISCDAPIREPFIAYLQGGLTYTTGRLAVLTGLQEMQMNHSLKLF
jgi:cystathionine beta-lyase family protein involved in aluminum resistance